MKKYIFVALVSFLNSAVSAPNDFWCERGHFNVDQASFVKLISSICAPRHVLETGFCTGRSASVLLTSTPVEQFISIDIDLNYMPEGRRYAQLLTDNFDAFKIIESNSRTVLTLEFFRSNFASGVDWATIDGDHTYEGCLFDLCAIAPHLSARGVIVIDDYKSGPPNGCHLPAVTEAIEKFYSDNRSRFYLLQWHCKGKGFAIVTKDTDIFNQLRTLENVIAARIPVRL